MKITGCAQFGCLFVCITSSWPSSSSGTKPLPPHVGHCCSSSVPFSTTPSPLQSGQVFMCASRGMLSPPTYIRWCFAEPARYGVCQSLWTIRSSEQFCTDSSFEFDETEWFERPKPSAQVFRSTLKIFADRVSSNRTDTRVGRRERTCVFKMRRSNPKRRFSSL